MGRFNGNDGALPREVLDEAHHPDAAFRQDVGLALQILVEEGAYLFVLEVVRGGQSADEPPGDVSGDVVALPVRAIVKPPFSELTCDTIGHGRRGCQGNYKWIGTGKRRIRIRNYEF